MAFIGVCKWGQKMTICTTSIFKWRCICGTGDNHHFTIEIPKYEKIIKSILSIRHFNYLKQFLLKLFRNTLYFKNVTIKFSDSGNLCNTCKSQKEDRIHFFKCEKHSEIINTLFFGFTCVTKVSWVCKFDCYIFKI